jgi:hypothetical protein
MEFRRLAIAKMQREMEALKLYVPLPLQEQFHANGAQCRLLRGSNRAGKTLSTAVEVARAVTGQDPHAKYPEKDGRCYIVGKDQKHLGEVIYRKLFQPNAFRMIRDVETKKWRSYRPWDPADADREKESRPAPPLIPKRFVQSITWESKSDHIPKKITLTTGWEIDFFSSLGKPPRGSDLDLVWFDEEIVDSDWFPEMLARLLDREGCLVWGATPQTGSDRLYELHQRCEGEFEEWRASGWKKEKEPDAREFLILLKDNPHVKDEQKRKLAKGLTDGDAAVRIDGDFAIEASKVWPEFRDQVHSLPYFDIPMDWTRYAVIDPGRQVCAVLFAAVPPEDGMIPVGVGPDGGVLLERAGPNPYVLLYDELYIYNCSAAVFGEGMALKCRGQEFEAFIIDGHGSRLTDIGSGLSVEEQYSKALEKHGIDCNRTGSRFTWGADDVKGGLEIVRGMLRVRQHGLPTILCVGGKDKLPNFYWEIVRYRYKRNKEEITDVPEDRGRVHLMADVRYLAAYGPKYVEPKRGRRATGAYAEFRRRQAKKAKQLGGTSVTLGPKRRT